MSKPVVIGNATLYLGDCLEVMPQVKPFSIQAVIADPPYGINTKSDGNGKLNPWADLCNSAFWYAEWFRQSRGRLLPSGCMWSFLNWRSLVTFQKAALDVGWAIESLMVWHKAWIGPGGSCGLRPSYELVALFANDGFAIEDRGLPDVQTFKWSGTKPNGHPAEKPLSLLEFLVRNSTRPDDFVFDPFMGSGTTGVACLNLGRRFIGVEIDPEHFSLACRRIEDSQRQQRMFA